MKPEMLAYLGWALAAAAATVFAAMMSFGDAYADGLAATPLRSAPTVNQAR